MKPPNGTLAVVANCSGIHRCFTWNTGRYEQGSAFHFLVLLAPLAWYHVWPPRCWALFVACKGNETRELKSPLTQVARANYACCRWTADLEGCLVSLGAGDVLCLGICDGRGLSMAVLSSVSGVYVQHASSSGRQPLAVFAPSTVRSTGILGSCL